MPDSDDSEHTPVLLHYSPYIDIDSLARELKLKPNNFTVFSLNAQSLHAKFDEIMILISDLKESGFEFGALCIQETWLDGNAKTMLYQIPNYTLVYTPCKASIHGGVAYYIHEKYRHTKHVCESASNTWDGMFIDVHGYNIKGAITIGNIYRPERYNTNYYNEIFLDEI